MALETVGERVICTKCGKAFGKRTGNFQVSYAVLYRGIGYLAICKECVEKMFSSYLTQSGSTRKSVRQMCRKLDLYWSEDIYESVAKKSTARTIMSQYISKLNQQHHVGKSYDDTLINEGSLWVFEKEIKQENAKMAEAAADTAPEEHVLQVEPVEVTDDVVHFWGTGYTPSMYAELEQRRAYWMTKFPKDSEQDLDLGTEALIRQICSLELDINRDRAAGRSVDKNVLALNTLLGSLKLKPVQQKQDDLDESITNTPLGVWLYRYENKRPLPAIDDDLKDVNGLRKYVFTWMGHLCKMLGLKNAYSKLYEDEIARLRVEKPEYDDEDDETFLMDLMEEGDDE